jgi:FtsP/CotA-like multicopper oxidase with cupredoxin domain
VSRTQRLSFLAVAVVIAIVAVVLLASSGGDDEEPAATGAQATATPTAAGTDQEPAATETATPTPTATPKPEPPLLQTGKVTKLRFKQGETVRFRVASPGGDEIHVHGYDIEKEIPAGKVVTVSFPADITGIFEIEFHGTAEQIGQLRVDPA